jgi:hypothetical protein
MKKTSLSIIFLLVLTLSLAACGEQKPEKNLPKEVVSTTPAPYTGEVGKPKEPGLQVYQVNADGTSQQVSDIKDVSPDKPAPLAAVGKGIVITKDGFTPSVITMKVGEKLMIQNTDAVEHQPASDPHPAHTDCPEFNAEKPLAPNEVFEVVVKEPKTCPIHDHLNPEMKATITVTE